MRSGVFMLLFSILLSGISSMVEGQYYFTGTDPASIRWKKIESEHFRTIFPEVYENEAYRIAGYLESAMAELSVLLNPTRRRGKTDVIIHPYSSESNGYVAWAPRRMEIFPAPRQGSLPFDQIESLLVHEVMHVVQMQALERRFTGFISYLLGEQITGAAAALLPLWYFEGDAVLYETLNAPGGRGSNPNFNRAMKALYSEIPEGYGYNKMLLGSYRNYTPDFYKYGYRMAEYSRLRYGEDLWRKAVENVAQRPYILNPLNQSLKNEAGTTKERLYNETIDTLLILWQSEVLSDPPLQYTTLNPNKQDNYINYCSPVTAGSDSIFAIKSSLSSPPSIVLLTDNGQREEHLIYQGLLYPNILSYSSGMLAWSERRPDRRWENRSYSVVILYDIVSGRTRQLTTRSRYFAPSLSPDGSKVVVAENSVENQNFLTIVDTKTGEVTERLPVPENGYPQKPEWSAEGDKIVSIILTKSGEKISTYTIAEDKWNTVIECSPDDLQSVALRGDTLFFVSSATGTDNIFMRTPVGEYRKVTSLPFGTGSFSLAGSMVIFDSYNWRGNEIATVSLNDSRPFDYGIREPLPSELYRNIPPAGRSSSTSGNIISDYNSVKSDSQEGQTLVTKNGFTATPYRKWKNLFNIHSWAPFWFDPDNITLDSPTVSPGITLLSQNSLSTLISSAGYEYDRGNHIIHSGFIWRGWYPVIEFKMSYGGSPLVSKRDDDPSPVTLPRRFSSTSTIYLPLRYRTGRYSQLLQPMFSHYYINRQIYEASPGTYNSGQHFFTARLFFSNAHRSAYRDIYPRYAQSFDLIQVSTPFDNSLYGGPLTSLRTAFYFPGLLPNHGIRVRLQTEKQAMVRSLHLNRALFPRGYESLIAGKLQTVTADYAFPIAYPDLAAGRLLYLKRLRGSLFADFSKGTDIYNYAVKSFTRGEMRFGSYGAELLTDFHILRIPYQITAGASFGYIPSLEKGFIEAVFQVDIQGFTLGNRRRSGLHP